MEFYVQIMSMYTILKIDGVNLKKKIIFINQFTQLFLIFSLIAVGHIYISKIYDCVIPHMGTLFLYSSLCTFLKL